MSINKIIVTLENPHICFQRSERERQLNAGLLGVKKISTTRKELQFIDCKTVNIWNFIKAFFGYGPLAGVDLHIQAVGQYIKENWQTIELSEECSPQLLDNISKIIRHCPYLNVIKADVESHHLFQQINILKEIGLNFSESKALLSDQPGMTEVTKYARDNGLENLVLKVFHKINDENDFIIKQRVSYILEKACQLVDKVEVEIVLNCIVAMYERPEIKDMWDWMHRDLMHWDLIHKEGPFNQFVKRAENAMEYLDFFDTYSPLYPSLDIPFDGYFDKKRFEFEPTEFSVRWKIAHSFGNRDLEKCLRVFKDIQKLPVETLQNLNFVNFISPQFKNLPFTPKIVEFLTLFQPAEQQKIINSRNFLTDRESINELISFCSKHSVEDRTNVIDWLTSESVGYDRQKFFISKCRYLAPNMLKDLDLILTKHFSISNINFDTDTLIKYKNCLEANITTQQILDAWENIHPFLSLKNILSLVQENQNNPTIDWKKLIEDIRPILVEHNSHHNYYPILYFSRKSSEDRLEWVKIFKICTRWFSDTLKNQSLGEGNMYFDWKIVNELSIKDVCKFAPLLDDFMDKPKSLIWEDRYAVFRLLRKIIDLNSWYSVLIENYKQLYERDCISAIITLLKRFKMCGNIPEHRHEGYRLIESGFPANQFFSAMICDFPLRNLREIEDDEQYAKEKIKLLGQMARGENENFNKYARWWLKHSRQESTPLTEKYS
jgi:hypothetical protein